MIRCAQGLSPFHKGWKCRYAHTTREEQEATIARLTAPKYQYIITSPDGTEHYTTELSKFCEEHELNVSMMCMISWGQRRHCRGWTCRFVDEPEEIRIKRESLKGKAMKFIVTTPEGEEVAVDHLNNFCDRHQICASTMIKVAKGKRPQHKGYKCRYAVD